MTDTQARPVVLIGAGKMGGAILDGWLAGGTSADEVVVVDPGLPAERRDAWAAVGVTVADALPEGLLAGVLLIAIKPQMMDEVLPGIARGRDRDTLVISIAAGTTIARLEDLLGEGPCVRAMPNTPAQIGKGTTVCVANGAVDAPARARADALLSAIGTVDWIEDEADMDAVTAVSGSGPAYVFYLAECLAAAAREAGLPPDLAERLATGTVAGAAALLAHSELDAATLRTNVTSPGGTTAVALERLMAEDGLERLMTEAVAAAQKRSRELAG